MLNSIMSKILLEDVQGEFVIDRAKIVEESVGDVTFTRIPGRLSVCGVVNGNGRRYSKKVWENNLKQDSFLMQLIERKAAFGTLEHPSDGKIDLLSPISHIVSEVKLNGETVDGAITILNTAEGRKLKALIEAGYNPTVSSRGYGSLVKAGDGVDEVQEDFVCEGWDVVMKPSFVQAIMVAHPKRKHESAAVDYKGYSIVIGEEVNNFRPVVILDPKGTKVGSHVVENAEDYAKRFVDTVLTEAISQPKAENGEKPVLEGTGASLTPNSKVAASPAAPSTTRKEEKSMDIKNLKESIAALQAVDPTKLTPARFAEGLSKLNSIHNDIAKWHAEDVTRSWEANQLHDEVKATEGRWSEAAAAPKVAASKLEESNTKLMTVIKAVADTGLKYKGKLGESIKEASKIKGLAEELAKRGRGWKARCESKEARIAELQEKLATSCQALDIIAKRYKEDMTITGRRVCELEFKEALTANPKLAEALKAATLPKQVMAVREELTKGIAPEAKAEEGEVPEAKVNESKEPVAPEASKAPAVTEAKKEDQKPAAEVAVTEGLKIVRNEVADPRNVMEAVALSRRLTKASAV